MPSESPSVPDPKEAARKMFGCEPHQIAWKQEDIAADTVAYIGPLFPGVAALPQIKHLFTDFPKGEIKKHNLEIGGKTKERLEADLATKEVTVSDGGLMKNGEWETAKNVESIKLVRLIVADLGFNPERFLVGDNPTTEEIFKRAEELGLELCPAEVGPHFRLSYTDQPQGEWVSVGMKPLNDQDDNLSVFEIGTGGGKMWLFGTEMPPNRRWNSAKQFLFRVREKE